MTNLSSILLIFTLTFIGFNTDNVHFRPTKGKEPAGCSTNRSYFSGPKGGCYYYNKNGNKQYVSKTCCGGQETSSTDGLLDALTAKNTQQKHCEYKGKTLFLGPKGGCYYLTPSGNKQYVERYLCNC
jgi:hypothetical protein